MKKPKHGGKRLGAGQPKKKPTKLINFRVEADLIDDAKERHGRTLNKKATAWLKEITYDKNKHDA